MFGVSVNTNGVRLFEQILLYGFMLDSASIFLLFFLFSCCTSSGEMFTYLVVEIFEAIVKFIEFLSEEFSM